MLSIPAALIAEKNALSNSSPFLVLCEIALASPASTTLRLVKNEVNITWDGETWSAFPFGLSDLGESGKNEVPSISLNVSNVSRAMQSYIEQYDGGIDATVTIRVVHADHLAETDPMVELQYTVTGCAANSKEVTFTLGGSNPWRRRAPQNRAFKNSCRWRFKSTRCGYSGSETECSKTITRCRALSNSTRFGAYIGCGYSGLKIHV